MIERFRLWWGWHWHMGPLKEIVIVLCAVAIFTPLLLFLKNAAPWVYAVYMGVAMGPGLILLKVWSKRR